MFRCCRYVHVRAWCVRVYAHVYMYTVHFVTAMKTDFSQVVVLFLSVLINERETSSVK